jgi:DNA-binding transcriptional regulator YdaS (Cro superfamily)
MKDKKLSAAHLIALRFGGADKLSKLLGISRQAVTQWYKTGEIPLRHQYAIMQLAKEKKVGLTKQELFKGGELIK